MSEKMTADYSEKSTQGKGSAPRGDSLLASDDPSSVDIPRDARETPDKGFHRTAITEAGAKSRICSKSFVDHYRQARQFYLSQTAYEQAHIASALVFELSKVEHLHIREAMVDHLRHIEENLASQITAGLAFDKIPVEPPSAAPTQTMKLSPALQI